MAEDAPYAAAEGSQPVAPKGLPPPPRRLPRAQGYGGAAPVAQHLAAVAAHA
jgi:hypothetical protein